MSKKICLLIMVIMAFGCSVDRDVDSNKEHDANNNNKRLAEDLEVFCNTGTEQLQSGDDFKDVELSYSVDGEEAAIIISGTVKNENDGMILYGIVSTFFSHSGISQEKVKIVWDAEIESKSLE